MTHDLFAKLNPKDPVRVVYFTSPSCPFCSKLDQEFLHSYLQELGNDIELVSINVTKPKGRSVFENFWSRYNVKDAKRGVPTIIVGDQFLVGAKEISGHLNDLVQKEIAKGGIDFPPIAGLEEYLKSHPPTTSKARFSIRDRVVSDLPGNYISIIQFLMMLTLMFLLIPKKPWQKKIRKTPMPLKIFVASIGLMTALYLSYGETFNQSLICGPLGQCNIVQQSSLAFLFGVFPLGVVGAIGYFIIIVLYLLLNKFLNGSNDASKIKAERYGQILAITSGFGFLFSIVLTFWQPFIIGATCIWCLISALTMSLTFSFNRDYLK